MAARLLRYPYRALLTVPPVDPRLRERGLRCAKDDPPRVRGECEKALPQACYVPVSDEEKEMERKAAMRRC